MSKFIDAQKRDWTVRITGETISAAAARGIDINLALLAKAAEGGNALEVLSFKVLGQFIDLCYLGCAHNSRIASGKVSETAFKEAITGEALIPAIIATVNAICECFGLKVEASPADPTPPSPPPENVDRG